MPLDKQTKTRATKQTRRARNQNRWRLHNLATVEAAPRFPAAERLVTAIPVCIFAKPPIAGQVKTRLAHSIGFEAAAALASAMLRDVWSTVASVPGVQPILAAASRGPFPIDVAPERLWLQPPGDLGFRMESILCRGLCNAPAALVLGADSPLLEAAHLRDALQVLLNHDAAIGPSHDGGFYLLGLRRSTPGLLADLPWSTCEAYEQTVNRLRSHALTVSTLKPLGDVDTLSDLNALADSLDRAPAHAAPFTRRWFAAHHTSIGDFS